VRDGGDKAGSAPPLAPSAAAASTRLPTTTARGRFCGPAIGLRLLSATRGMLSGGVETAAFRLYGDVAPPAAVA